MVQFGTVLCYFAQDSRCSGFIQPDDGGPDVFFHITDYAGRMVEEDPIEGDRVYFSITVGRDKRQRAGHWGYLHEYRPKFFHGRPLEVSIDLLPVIKPGEIEDDDLCIMSLDVEGDWGRDPGCETWINVILRISTGELFQLRCWMDELDTNEPHDLWHRPCPSELEITLN